MMQGRAMGKVLRAVSRFECHTCGAMQEFVLHRRDRVDHTCGWRGAGGTWWVHRGAGR